MAGSERAVRIAKGMGLAALGMGAMALMSEAMGRAHERQVPRDGVFGDVPGARLHYLVRGEGPPIVFVHGLGGQLRNFTYALTERLESCHRIVAVDRPGSGYSVSVRGPRPGIAEQARAVAGLIERLELDRPLLVGHSLGGAVSLALAQAHPDLVRGLALIAPLTQPIDEVPDVFRFLAAGAGGRGRGLLLRTLGVPLGKLTQKQSRSAVFAPEPAPEDFGVRGGGLLALRPKNIDNAAGDLLAAHGEMPGIASRYGTMALPVSILYGRDDALLDPNLHGEMTAGLIPGARLTLIDGGHMIPITQPDATARFVEEAFARMG